MNHNASILDKPLNKLASGLGFGTHIKLKCDWQRSYWFDTSESLIFSLIRFNQTLLFSLREKMNVAKKENILSVRFAPELVLGWTAAVAGALSSLASDRTDWLRFDDFDRLLFRFLQPHSNIVDYTLCDLFSFRTITSRVLLSHARSNERLLQISSFRQRARINHCSLFISSFVYFFVCLLSAQPTQPTLDTDNRNHSHWLQMCCIKFIVWFGKTIVIIELSKFSFAIITMTGEFAKLAARPKTLCNYENVRQTFDVPIRCVRLWNVRAPQFRRQYCRVLVK